MIITKDKSVTVYALVQGEIMKINYEIKGKPTIDIVVEAGLMSCIAEWRPLAEKLAAEHGVLIYERAGVGLSECSDNPRTPKNIASECFELLSSLPHTEQILLIAHSQGGLYAQQFARMYPQLVRGIILLDPLSASDNSFKTLLTEEEYKKGGVDKFSNLGAAKKLLRLHLGFILKAMMKNAPPMYYYSFKPEDKAYILDNFVKVNSYDTAEQEYQCAHDESLIEELKKKEGFPDIPLVLITHSSALSEKEIREFGRASEETAQNVEKVWQQIMGEYLTFSSKSSVIRAEKSTHYIHLMQPELVLNAVSSMCNEK